MWLQVINKVKVTYQGEGHIKVKVKYLHPLKFYVARTLQAGGLHSTEMLLVWSICIKYLNENNNILGVDTSKLTIGGVQNFRNSSSNSAVQITHPKEGRGVPTNYSTKFS